MVDEDRDRRGWGGELGDFWRVSGIAFVVAVLIAGGAILGVWADRSLGTKPVFSLSGLVAGLSSGAWYAYRAVREMIK